MADKHFKIVLSPTFAIPLKHKMFEIKIVFILLKGHLKLKWFCRAVTVFTQQRCGALYALVT